MEWQLSAALKVLGIPADSDREQVTNAYRRLARVTHPDVSPAPDAAEQFATVTAAYRLVSASSRPSRRSGRAAVSSESLPLRRLPRPPYLSADSGCRLLIEAGPVMVRRSRGTAGVGDG